MTTLFVIVAAVWILMALVFTVALCMAARKPLPEVVASQELLDDIQHAEGPVASTPASGVHRSRSGGSRGIPYPAHSVTASPVFER